MSPGRRGRRGAALALAALLLLRAGGVRAEPVKIRIGWVVAQSNLVPVLFAKQGIARHLGQSYTIEPIHFAGTSPQIAGLGAGELDIATLAYSSFALAIDNAHMTDLRVLADNFQDGVAGCYSNEFMVRKDSPIRTVEDLKGRVLASNTAGSAVDMAIRVMLRRHGLDDKKDVTIVEVGFPNMKAMLAERKVDLISAIPANAHDPELRAMARPLFTQKDAIGPTQMIVWAARRPFVEAHRAALVDFLEDALRARRFYTDPANHREAVELVARFVKQPAEQLDPWLFHKERDYCRDPQGLPDLAAFQKNIATQRELGFLKGEIDIAKYAELGPEREAAARLQ
jgi:NitT/TauT family transport system substrate-binding protein